MTQPTRLLALFLGTVAVMAMAACTSTGDAEGDPSDTSGTAAPNATIETHLTDGFLIDVASATANAGAVAFEVGNSGQLLHNFVIIRTDLDQGALPIDGVQVDISQLTVVAQTIDLPPGQNQLLLTDLEAGQYVLICNIPGHYNAGMHRAFTVK